MSQIDEIKKRITSLECDIKNTDAEIARLTAEATIADTPSRLELVRKIVEAREISRLNRLALRAARADLAAEQDAAQRDERVARRDAMAKVIDAIERDAEALQRSLRRSGRIYQRLNESVRNVIELGPNAQAFDMTTFRTTQPARAPYVFAVHAFASTFGLTPGDHIEHWPKPDQTADGMARAFASFYRSRDEWRSPELFAVNTEHGATGTRDLQHGIDVRDQCRSAAPATILPPAIRSTYSQTVRTLSQQLEP
jgi:hypothetical protein